MFFQCHNGALINNSMQGLLSLEEIYLSLVLLLNIGFELNIMKLHINL